MGKEKRLSETQEGALQAIEVAEDMRALTLAVAQLSADERNDRRVAYAIYEATQRIVGKTVPL